MSASVDILGNVTPRFEAASGSAAPLTKSASPRIPNSESEDSENDEETVPSDDSEGSTESAESTDDTDSSDEEDAITPEMLEDLLNSARASLAAKARSRNTGEGEVLALGVDERPLPALDPGPSLPKPYFSAPSSSNEPARLVNDPATTSLSKATGKRKAGEPEAAPLTKRQRREVREKTAGPAWFDLPAPSGTDLVKIKREMEANRLRNALDPKRFYRKEAMREGDLPKYVALGRVISTRSPFTTSSKKNLARAERKQSIVEELVADAEAKTYAKKKFNELQSVRGERGRSTLRRKKELKRKKW